MMLACFRGLQQALLRLARQSIVPRPFPPPVFDRLQHTNMEGGGLGDLVVCGYVSEHQNICKKEYGYKAIVQMPQMTISVE